MLVHAYVSTCTCIAACNQEFDLIFLTRFCILVTHVFLTVCAFAIGAELFGGNTIHFKKIMYPKLGRSRLLYHLHSKPLKGTFRGHHVRSGPVIF